jgi:hypothetical protein
MKLIMLCGVPCLLGERCLEEQKEKNKDYIVFDKTTSEEEIVKVFSEQKPVIWDNLNLYPEIRKYRLSFVPPEYHKTAMYYKPSEEELNDEDLRILNMQFVAPTEFENFECIMRYM